MKRALLALTTLALIACASAAPPPEARSTAAGPTPLTFANVRHFFSDTLHIRPTEVQKRCVIFYEGEFTNSNTYDYCVIIVENSDDDLQVTFYITDDREMNWVNEFLEGSFFTCAETENLYRLLHREKHAREEKVGRFRVDVSRWEPRHAEIIVFSFSPERDGSSCRTRGSGIFREDGAQLVKVERLGEVFIEAGAQPAFLLLALLVRGQGDGFFPRLPLLRFHHQVEPASVGQSDVAHQHFKTEMTEQDQRILHGRRGRNFMAAVGEET